MSRRDVRTDSEPADPLIAAMLLAALAAGDEGAARARLAPPLREALARAIAATSAQRAADRGAFLAALARAVAPAIGAADAMPAAARAIVAPLAPREIGARWMRDAAPPRAGFRASAALRTTLATMPEDAWRA